MRSHRLLELSSRFSFTSLLQVDCQRFLFTSLMQVCKYQVWFSQIWCNLMKPTGLMQLDDKLASSRYNPQLAPSLCKPVPTNPSHPSTPPPQKKTTYITGPHKLKQQIKFRFKTDSHTLILPGHVSFVQMMIWRLNGQTTNPCTPRTEVLRARMISVSS